MVGSFDKNNYTICSFFQVFLVKLEGEGTQIGASDFHSTTSVYTKCNIKLGGWGKLIITSYF